MAVTIDKLTNGWAKVTLNPSIDGSKELIINYSINVVRVRLVDDPETLDFVKVYLVDGEVLELHFSVGVVIDSHTCNSNQDIVDQLEIMFTS